MDRHTRGFSLIELMVVVAIIGLLAAIAIPMFMGHTNKAKGTEAVLQLEVLAMNATLYHAANGQFPVGTAAVLPGPDGGGCKASSRTMAASRGWGTDAIWSALDFDIGEPTRFSYHYEATGPHSARAWATADLACTGKLVTYELVMEGRCSGSVSWVLIDPMSRTNPAPPAPSADCGTTGGSDGSTAGSTSSGSSSGSGGSTSGSGGSTSGSGGSTGGAGSTGGGGTTGGGGGGSTSGGGGSTSGGGSTGGGGSTDDSKDDPPSTDGASAGSSSGGASSGNGTVGGGSAQDDEDDDEDTCVKKSHGKCQSSHKH